MKKKIKINCAWCGTQFTKKHPAQKFHTKQCKDRFHNEHNPRGYFAHLNPQHPDYDEDSDSRLQGSLGDDDQGWDAHKDY